MTRMLVVHNPKFTIMEFHTCTARPRNTRLWGWKLHYCTIFIKVGSSYRYDMKNQRAYSLPPLLLQSAHRGVLSESVCSASFAILEFSCFRGTRHMNFVCNNHEDFVFDNLLFRSQFSVEESLDGQTNRQTDKQTDMSVEVCSSLENRARNYIYS